ncbi:hypothetical protein ABZP36_034291 [Zizania latifolia]
MAADVSSVTRLLRGEARKRGTEASAVASEVVMMDLLEIDCENLKSGKTFLTPRLQGIQLGHQDLNLPPLTAATAIATATSTSTAVCTLDMVHCALERTTAKRATASASPAASSSSLASTSSSSSSAGKFHRSPPASTATPASPSMRAAACMSCLTYVLITKADPRYPRCSGNIPPLTGKPRDAASYGDGSGKKPKIDLNAAADDTE